MLKKSLAVSALAMMVSASFATFTGVTSSAALGGNDFIDWSQFGPAFTGVTSGSFGLTNGGRLFQVISDNGFGSDDGGALTRLDEGNGWTGEFQPGDALLWHQNSFKNDFSVTSDLELIFFSNDIIGVGTQSQANAGGNFTSFAGYWNPYPGNPIGFTQNSGVNNVGTHNGSAYTGGYTDGAIISQFFVVSSMDDGSDNFGFAVGRIDLKTSPVPEPASMTILGMGALALVRRRRKN